jgi:hypothetical protein
LHHASSKQVRLTGDVVVVVVVVDDLILAWLTITFILVHSQIRIPTPY